MTPVIFRVWLKDNEVFAIFPTLPGSHRYDCTVYRHIGQHSSADYGICASNRSRLATPGEYGDLLAELRLVGYDDLKVYKRKSYRMDRMRTNNFLQMAERYA